MKQRGLKKLVSMILAVMMVLAMSATALAATITIENTTTGKTYTAYKIFDATGSGDKVSYTIDSTSAWYDTVSAARDVFTLTQAGQNSTTYYVTVNEKVEDTAVITVFSSVPEGATIAATGTGDGGSVSLGDLAPGYYYITTTNGSAVTIDTNIKDIKLIDKNQTPGGDLDKTADDAEAQIGDTVKYTITSDVPAYDGETEIEKYTFTDTLSSGLTAPTAEGVTVQILKLDNTDGTVEIKDEKYSEITVEDKVINVTVNSAENTITVSYNPKEITNYPADAVIMITYTATVNRNAVEENGNEVKQTWTNDSTGKTETETVYTYGFNLIKVDGASAVKDNEGKITSYEKKLDGAKFKLYTSETEGNAIRFSYDSTENIYTVDPDGSVTEIEVGNAAIFGLDSDITYYLEETQAPAGYNVLKDRVEVTIDKSGTSEVEGVVTISQNVQVENNSGTELPSTGGIGTTIFYIVGGVLVLGAAVLFVTKRRLSNEN